MPVSMISHLSRFLRNTLTSTLNKVTFLGFPLNLHGFLLRYILIPGSNESHYINDQINEIIIIFAVYY